MDKIYVCGDCGSTNIMAEYLNKTSQPKLLPFNLEEAKANPKRVVSFTGSIPACPVEITSTGKVLWPNASREYHIVGTTDLRLLPKPKRRVMVQAFLRIVDGSIEIIDQNDESSMLGYLEAPSWKKFGKPTEIEEE